MAHAYCNRAIDGREKQVLANVVRKEPRWAPWRCAGRAGARVQVCPGGGRCLLWAWVVAPVVVGQTID